MGGDALTQDASRTTLGSVSQRVGERPPPWLSAIRGAIGVVVFLGAIRLLGQAAGTASGEMSGILAALRDRPLSALGLGWLFTYVLTNGSVVAAVGVALAGTEPGDPRVTLALVSGSRLGAAAFVVGIGVLDHLRKRGSFRAGVELGVLSFVLSHAVYVPATLVAWALLPILLPSLADLTSRIDPAFLQPGIVDATAVRLVGTLGPVTVAAGAIVGLLAGVYLFDRALRGIELERLRHTVSLDRRWLSFLTGLVVTGLTSSVAFSIGVLVPLYNRGAITRKEITPYVLGANVTTLIDTFVVSVVLRSWDAGGTVLALMLIALVLSLAFLGTYRQSFRILDKALDAVTVSRATFILFLASLVAAPLILVLAGGWP